MSDPIRALLEEFTDRFRTALAEMVADQIRGNTSSTTVKQLPADKRSPVRTKSNRRTPDEIEETKKKVVRVITTFKEHNDGPRSEDIKKALNLSAAEVQDAVFRLRQEGLLRDNGVPARHMRYQLKGAGRRKKGYFDGAKAEVSPKSLGKAAKKAGKGKKASDTVKEAPAAAS